MVDTQPKESENWRGREIWKLKGRVQKCLSLYIFTGNKDAKPQRKGRVGWESEVKKILKCSEFWGSHAISLTRWVISVVFKTSLEFSKNRFAFEFYDTFKRDHFTLAFIMDDLTQQINSKIWGEIYFRFYLCPIFSYKNIFKTNINYNWVVLKAQYKESVISVSSNKLV